MLLLSQYLCLIYYNYNISECCDDLTVNSFKLVKDVTENFFTASGGRKVYFRLKRAHGSTANFHYK